MPSGLQRSLHDLAVQPDAVRAHSVPAEELAETEVKLEALLPLLV